MCKQSWCRWDGNQEQTNRQMRQKIHQSHDNSVASWRFDAGLFFLWLCLMLSRASLTWGVCPLSSGKKRTPKPKNRTSNTKEFLNNLRSLANKIRGLRQITPESSPERSANSLSHKFFGAPSLSLKWHGVCTPSVPDYCYGFSKMTAQDRDWLSALAPLFWACHWP